MSSSVDNLKAGDRVTWTLLDGTKGLGTIAADPTSTHAFVAVDPLKLAPGLRQSSLEFHPVIWCTLTWLTKVNP